MEITGSAPDVADLEHTHYFVLSVLSPLSITLATFILPVCLDVKMKGEF